jgi:hypothetical protein
MIHVSGGRYFAVREAMMRKRRSNIDDGQLSLIGQMLGETVDPLPEVSVHGASGNVLQKERASEPAVASREAAEAHDSIALRLGPETVSFLLNAPRVDVSEAELRFTDLRIENAFSILLKNDVKTYSALIRLAERDGERKSQYIWRVQVGYSVLVPESNCSTRALERAFPRLAALNYVIRYPEAHGGKIAATYWVRTPEGVMATFEASGCTHFRVLRGKRIQLLRQKLPDRLAGGV